MRKETAILIFVISIGLCGCAEINPFEAPSDIIRNPLGPESIRIGMGKDEVMSKWGEPDITNKSASKDATGNKLLEEWVYRAGGYTPVPIDKAYLHKNKYLYFEGNVLTEISDEPRGQGGRR